MIKGNLIPHPKKEKYRSDNSRKINSAKNPNCYLYILHIEGTTHYKIGVSGNPKRRVRDIRSCSPYNINAIYVYKHNNTYELEEMIHDNFKEKEMNHEWFDLDDSDIERIFNTLKDFRDEKLHLIRIKSCQVN